MQRITIEQEGKDKKFCKLQKQKGAKDKAKI